MTLKTFVLPLVLLLGVARASQDGLTKEQINDTVAKKMPSLKGCYEEVLKANPTLSGLVRTSIEISASGAVSDVKIEINELKDAQFETCMIGAIREWTFPAPAGGVTVKTSYPFRFNPKKSKKA